MPFINEAAYALMEGVAEAESIDTIAKLGFAHPLGPLALADLIGLDTCVAIMDVLHRGRRLEVRAVPPAAAVRAGRPPRTQVRPGLLRVLTRVPPFGGGRKRPPRTIECGGDTAFAYCLLTTTQG